MSWEVENQKESSIEKDKEIKLCEFLEKLGLKIVEVHKKSQIRSILLEQIFNKKPIVIYANDYDVLSTINSYLVKINNGKDDHVINISIPSSQVSISKPYTCEISNFDFQIWDCNGIFICGISILYKTIVTGLKPHNFYKVEHLKIIFEKALELLNIDIGKLIMYNLDDAKRSIENELMTKGVHVLIPVEGRLIHAKLVLQGGVSSLEDFVQKTYNQSVTLVKQIIANLMNIHNEIENMIKKLINTDRPIAVPPISKPINITFDNEKQVLKVYIDDVFYPKIVVHEGEEYEIPEKVAECLMRKCKVIYEFTKSDNDNKLILMNIWVFDEKLEKPMNELPHVFADGKVCLGELKISPYMYDRDFYNYIMEVHTKVSEALLRIVNLDSCLDTPISRRLMNLVKNNLLPKREEMTWKVE